MILRKDNKLYKKILMILLILVFASPVSLIVFANGYESMAAASEENTPYVDAELEESELGAVETQIPEEGEPHEVPPGENKGQTIPESSAQDNLVNITSLEADEVQATVQNEAQLQAALNNTSVTYILLEDNIVLNNTSQNYRITNTSARTGAILTIDGQNQYSITQNNTGPQRGIILDHNNSGYGGQLREIRIENMDITSNMSGGPFNGFVTTSDYAAYSTLAITFSNVNFIGVRAVKAKYSTCVFQDCTFTLTGINSNSSLAFADNVTMSGEVNITRENTLTTNVSILELSNNGTITVKDNAKVYVLNNPNTTVVNYSPFINGDQLNMTVGENAEFVCESDTQSSFIFGADNYFKNIIVNKGAKFDIRAMGPSELTWALIDVSNLQVEEDAEFYLVRGKVGTGYGSQKSALTIKQNGGHI